MCLSHRQTFCRNSIRSRRVRIRGRRLAVSCGHPSATGATASDERFDLTGNPLGPRQFQTDHRRSTCRRQGRLDQGRCKASKTSSIRRAPTAKRGSPISIGTRPNNSSPPTASRSCAPLLTTYKQLNRDENGLELKPFRNCIGFTLEIHQFGSASLRPTIKPRPTAKSSTRSASELDEYQKQPSAALAASIGRRLQVFETLGQSPEFVAAVKQKYAQPNALVDASTSSLEGIGGREAQSHRSGDRQHFGH